MRRLTVIPAVLLVVILSAVPLEAQERRWAVRGRPYAGFEVMDQAVQTYMKTWEVPGIVLVVGVDGQMVATRAYTWDDPAVEPLTPNSLFRIASMSKPITSVAIHMLIEQGLISYETRIADALGLEAPPGGQASPWLAEVTVDDLLYHIGGWDRNTSYDPMFFDGPIATALGVDLPISKYDIAAYMTGQPMQFSPGARFAYSNYGYCLLGMLIEEVTGIDYTEWVMENIFRPIGVGRPRLGHSLESELAPTETRYEGVGEDPHSFNQENLDSHGGWVMSAPDFLRFMDAVFGSRELLSDASIEAMTTMHPRTAGSGYARGWSIEEGGGVTGYGHGGSLPGLTTEGTWQTDGLSFVSFVNTRKDMGDFGLEPPTSFPTDDLFEIYGISPETLGAGMTECWVPAVAKDDGAQGSSWLSDVGLLNRSTLKNQVRLRVGIGTNPTDIDLELQPGEYRTMSDVVGAAGLAGSGALRAFSSEPLTVTSRTFNQGSAGTFGQYLAGDPAFRGLRRPGDSAVLTQLREDQVARSNIGLLNTGRRSASIRVELYEHDASEIATFSVEVTPGQRLQLNRPFFDRGGRTDISSGYAVLTLESGNGVLAYGSVVDNLTNDPTTIPMKLSAGATTLWIAAAANASGEAGSQWRTDLAILNRSGGPAQVTVDFRGDGGGRQQLQLTLADGEQRLLADVVGELGVEAVGSLEISSDVRVVVGSRTYNIGSSGTFGQYLDGVNNAGTAAAGDVRWLPQLRQDAAFRTNIGVLNTGDAEARVRVRLYNVSGTELASTLVTLTPGGRSQLQQPFDNLAGRTDLTDGYATLTVETGDGVIAFASVVDNLTNDPTTIPMIG